MKNNVNSLGRHLARRFSAAGLYMGILELAAIAVLLGCFMHNRWGAEETAWVLAVMGLCEIIRAVMTVRFNRRLTRKALSPLTDIAQQLERITASNLSERFAVGGGFTGGRGLQGRNRHVSVHRVGGGLVCLCTGSETQQQQSCQQGRKELFLHTNDFLSVIASVRQSRTILLRSVHPTARPRTGR